jgi:hypothetical protein
MTSCRFAAALLLVSACHALVGSASEPESTFSAADIEFFEKEIRPVLVKRCYECHGEESEELAGGLRVDSRAALVSGGESGPAVVPGNPTESLLIDAINYGEYFEMPPKSKLPAAEVALLTDWVKRGAPWPVEQTKSSSYEKKFDLAARKESHWAWHPVVRHDPPTVKQTTWPSSPIDQFLLAKVEEAGLTPADPADRRTLIRRVYFDLIGLPPTPEEVATFVSDASPQAFGKVVDHLLASPRFGERWGRHWLDLMRYAESRGHEFDYNAANAWQYRDYVIRALNEDVPYDQFVREHIAGDLLPRPRRHVTEGFNESILATGFWFLGDWCHSPVDIRQDELDRLDNSIDTMSKAFLGLTVACARCHDHKFDAISQRDYYAMSGFLQSSSYRQARFESLDHNREVAKQLATLRTTSAAAILHEQIDRIRPGLERVADSLATVSGDREKAKRWQVQMATAQKDTRNPLHAWARLVAVKEADAEATAKKRHAVAQELINLWKTKWAQATAERKDMRIVVDFSTANPQDFIQDGSAFGLSPIAPGEVMLDSANKTLSVATYGAARRDPAFCRLVNEKGTQAEPGALGKWQRAGQTLRTPTFTLGGGRLHYLVVGAGNVQAVVDSHRMIAGPLHGSLVKRWGIPKQTGPHWVTHDLSRYSGHGVHVEFSPEGDGSFEVLMVVEGDRPPSSLLAAPNTRVVGMLETFVADQRENEFDIARLASSYQMLLIDVADKVASGGIPTSPQARDDAAIARWLVENRDLFQTANEGRADRLNRLWEEFIAKETALKEKVVTKSHSAIAILDGNGVNERFLVRGNHKMSTDLVPRRFLEAFVGPTSAHPPGGSGRLELANQITNPETNPLIARVTVNRIWLHLFGRGIVPTPDNFGVLGQPPSHPELLDYLAGEFVRDGWSTKKMIRRLVLTRSYRMSSKLNPAAVDIDPDNVLLHRMNIRRLQGEAIRDSLLAISGRLDVKMYGAPVPVYLTKFMQGRGRPGNGPLDGAGRRSIYISVRRNFLSPMMLVFDTPVPSQAVGRRNASNVPAQALTLMNDPFVVQQSQLWAKRLLQQELETAERRIAAMYESAFARLPTKQEIEAAIGFLRSQAETAGLPADRWQTEERLWADLCHALINSKEFIFLR